MVLVIAHRGASRVARENTVAAFQAARAQGADGVELDVRRTADDRLVVHHDADVPDLGPIVERRASELPDWVPSLDEALDACAGLAEVNVEIKHGPVEPDSQSDRPIGGLVASALLARLPDGPRLVVSSFDLAVIDAHRQAAPELPTGWLTLPGVDQLEAVATVVAHGHQALHPHHAATTSELVSAAHRAGVRVAVWTVDDPSRAVDLAAMGVDAIITNVPDVIRAAVG